MEKQICFPQTNTTNEIFSLTIWDTLKDFEGANNSLFTKHEEKGSDLN